MVEANQIDIDQTYTRGEAARRLERSPARIDQLAASGALPFIRTRLGKLYDADAVDRMARERQHLTEPTRRPVSAR